MTRRVLVAAFALAMLAACGGGGGGGTATTPIVMATATPSPTATPGPYATMLPLSTRQGDVNTLATGGGATAMAYWPDFNILVLGVGQQVIDPGDNSVIATAPDSNTVTAIAYSSSMHSIVFATPTDIYSKGTSGAVLTLAVNLQHVLSLAVGNDGTVYAIDTDHVVKISGAVATNVTAPGSIGAPSGSYNTWTNASLAVASDGSLLLADAGNNVVERVSTSGVITPLAGSCKPGAGATGSAGSCWRVAQSGTGSAANFGAPQGIAYDPATGITYVADTQTNQLWAVAASGSATPVAGYGALFNADGNGLAAFLDAPLLLAMVPQTHAVAVLEYGGAGAPQAIVTYTVSGSAPRPYTPPAQPFYFPNGLATSDLGASPDGGAWAVDANQKNVDRISSTGAVTRYPTSGGIAPTWHVAVDANGDAWFLASHFGGGIIQDTGVLEVTPSGTFTYTAASPQHSGASSFLNMGYITIGPDGNPWFTESEPMYGGSFGVVNASSNVMTQYATSTGPNGIAPGPNGAIAYSTFANNKQNIVLSSTSGQISATYPVSLNSANSLKFRASDNTLWFTDTAGSIASVNASGTEQDYKICSQCDPVNLTVAPDGSIWSDEGNESGGIIRITPAGTMSQYLLPISVGPTYGISARADGKLWVYNNFGVLYLFDPSAYDAMNGPHVTPQSRRRTSSALRMQWHRRF